MSRGFQCLCVPESYLNNVLLNVVLHIIAKCSVRIFFGCGCFQGSLEQLGVDDAALRIRLVEPRNFAVQ